MGKFVLVFVGFLLAASTGLPTSKKDEVEPVEPITTYGDQPIVDTGIFGGWENPFSTSFGGLFDNLEGLMDRMRNQIATLLNRFPLNSKSNSTDSLFPFPGIGSLPGIGDIDLSKGNTTSITKVIDGRTVVINETEYKNEDDFGGTFFKVRVIDVKPENEETTTVEAREKEPTADSWENEISKSKEAGQDFNQSSIEFEDLSQTFSTSEPVNDEKLQWSSNKEYQTMDPLLNQNTRIESLSSVETFTNANKIDYEKDDTNSEDKLEKFDENMNPEWNNFQPMESIESNDIDEKEFHVSKHEIGDLSRDTYVNVLAAKNGMTPNPDAEVFQVFDPR
ncbi:uncharacterized protein LOC126741246 [Anthonomus grandis grandis]|uniref:uncharacterized protein LOC126741246 n=1 Tax=Anthonomus grandis grandis TaxID=2921223 RepID=UPI00216576FE|nr:uncharacterized protein LOC126741246 [Anthonomus grandis grandis]